MSRSQALALGTGTLALIVAATAREGLTALALVSPLVGLLLLALLLLPVARRARQDRRAIPLEGALFSEEASAPITALCAVLGLQAVDVDHRPTFARVISPGVVQGYVRLDQSGFHFEPWPRVQSPELRLRLPWAAVHRLSIQIERKRASLIIGTDNESLRIMTRAVDLGGNAIADFQQPA